MKTTMQELIDYLKSLAFSECHIGMGDIVLTQGHIDELQEKYIEKEKEQILRAYNNGSYDITMKEDYRPIEYYNQTYNQNK